MQDRKVNLTKQDTIRAQLTLRAVIWDIPKLEKVEAGRLDQEMAFFQISRVETQEFSDAKKTPYIEENAYACKKYEKAAKSLQALGISEKEAVVVTGDASMAEYAYRMGNTRESTGIGVVYYEKEGSRKDVLADITVLGFEEVGVQFLDRIHKRRNHLPWNILYTERTCVREITMADLDELYMLYDGEGITDYTEPLYERQKEEEYTKSYIDNVYYYYGYGMWIVRDRQSGALIGRVGIEHRDAGGEVLTELGYIIAKEYQNMGYATEVCKAVIAYADQELEIGQLHCFIHPDNRVSIHLAEKLGFKIVTDECKGQGEYLHFRL